MFVRLFVFVVVLATASVAGTPAGVADDDAGFGVDWTTNAPLLGIGASGPPVVEWQEAMNDWLDVVAPSETFRLRLDGEYGRLTDSVTRRFQFAQGIPVDGLVGPVTRSAYLSASELIAVGRGPADHQPVLAPGDRGPEVRAWQEALDRWIVAADVALPSLVVDGDYGPRTEAAVRSFQRSQGVTVDGLVGPETRAALASAPALVNAAPPRPASARRPAAPPSPPPDPRKADPAAGICSSTEATVAEIVLRVDAPDPRCTRLSGLQWIRVVNDGPPTGFSLGTWETDLAAGEVVTSPLPVGAYVQSGTLVLRVDRYGSTGPELVVRG